MGRMQEKRGIECQKREGKEEGKDARREVRMRMQGERKGEDARREGKGALWEEQRGPKEGERGDTRREVEGGGGRGKEVEQHQRGKCRWEEGKTEVNLTIFE